MNRTKKTLFVVLLTLISVSSDPVNAASPNHLIIKGMAWINAQEPGDYTIQLAAFQSLDEAKVFVASNSLKEIPQIVFNKSESTYKLLYKIFNKRIQAQQSLRLLPRSIELYSPWIRRIRDVLTSIDKPEAKIVSTNQAGHSIDKIRLNRRNLNNRLTTGQRAFNHHHYKKSYISWHPLAQIGMAEAQYNLGFMFDAGWGVEQDYTTAFNWYRLSAEQGFAKSQFNLGKLYEAGLGVRKDKVLALDWIRQAADNNDTRAIEYLRKQKLPQ